MKTSSDTAHPSKVVSVLTEDDFKHNLGGIVEDLEIPNSVRYVFDSEQSEIRTYLKHAVSFVLPKWLSTSYSESNHPIVSDENQTTLLKGKIVYMQFSLEGDAIEEPKLNKKGFCINGIYYPLLPEFAEIQKEGVEAARLYRLNGDSDVPGDDPCYAPRVLCLSKVHVKISKKHKCPTGHLHQIMSDIRNMTGRAVHVIPSLTENIISIPIQWVVHDLTSLTEYNKRNPNKKIVPIEKADAFPSIGTRIIYNVEYGDGNKEEKIGLIDDFGVREDGSTVQANIQDINDPKLFEPIPYSNIFAPKNVMFHHNIIRTITVSEMKRIKETYLDDSRDQIFRAMSQWTPFKVEGLRILASEYISNNTDDSLRKTKIRWITPSETISKSELNIVSFEHGTAVIDGVTYRITYRENPSSESDADKDSSEENTIDLHDIPSTKNVTQLVFNAAIGTAEAIVTAANGDRKKLRAFFSTHNGVDITTRRTPLFSTVVPTERVTIDATSFSRNPHILGYVAKSTQEDHTDQDVVYWSRVPAAFGNFYLFVTSKGAHPTFAGKTISQVRNMFVSEEFPTLVEIYNFMIFGVSNANPTLDSKWTEFFVGSCLGVSISDLN